MSRRVLRRGRSVLDPDTPAEWREAVDGASLMLAIDAAHQYGLVDTDLVVDVPRAEEILKRGRARNVRPRPLEQLLTEFGVGR